MRILYGVQATGNGHINRSREVVKELRNRGHEVLTIFSGREKEDLWGIEEFGDHMIFKGLTFKTKNGKMQYFNTVKGLNFPGFYKDVLGLSKIVDGYHLVISDFEQITSRVAKATKTFSINLSHQASFHYNKIPNDHPSWMTMWIIKKYVECNINIGIHWFHFGNDGIIPPIIPQHLQDKTIRNKYLVYLPFEDTDKMIDVLRKFPTKDFYVYSKNAPLKTNEHIHWRPFSRTTFLTDLEEAEGIICNAGFELISESLSIGKKILCKPVKNQMEQESNASAISLLGLGKTTDEIRALVVEDFIYYSEKCRMIIPNTAKIFVDWIEKRDWTNIKTLTDSFW
jgi:uncharacterized protein (TIGR00661 family)